jgi:hypothetical protein
MLQKCTSMTMSALSCLEKSAWYSIFDKSVAVTTSFREEKSAQKSNNNTNAASA